MATQDHNVNTPRPVTRPKTGGRRKVGRWPHRYLRQVQTLAETLRPYIAPFKSFLYPVSVLTLVIILIGVFYAPRSDEISLALMSRFKFPDYWERVFAFSIVGAVGTRLVQRKKANLGTYMADVLVDLVFVPVATLFIISLMSKIHVDDIGMRDFSLSTADPMILNGMAFVLGGFTSYRLQRILDRIRNGMTTKSRKGTKQTHDETETTDTKND